MFLEMMEEEPWLVFVLLFMVGVILLFILLFIIGKKKTKKGEALYKVKYDYLNELNQFIVKTNLKFSAKTKGQDAIFMKEFPIGKKIMIENKEETISRVVKQREAQGIATGFCYVVYFKEYEFSEFPQKVNIKKNNEVDEIILDTQGISFLKDQRVMDEISFEECIYDNADTYVEVHVNKDKRIRIYRRTVLSENEYTIFEEILVKYARNLYVHYGMTSQNK